MRVARIFAPTVGVLIGAYLLLIANGLSGEMRNQAHGWHFFPLPSRPRARIIAYLTVATALQFGSAWMLMPAVHEERMTRFWGWYAVRVACLLAACVVVAFIGTFVVMALLDSGAI